MEEAVNDVERKLQDAFNAKDEKAFSIALAECNDFKQIFKFTLQCATATFAPRISVVEKITLEDMMECGLKRMYALNSDNWLSELGDDAHQLVKCVRVIENYKFPFNRNKLFNFGSEEKNDSGLKLGYLLWSCCEGIIDNKEFSGINNFVLSNLEQSLWPVFHYACDTGKWDEYFGRVNACIKRKLLSPYYISSQHGDAMEVLFNYWCAHEEERETVLSAMQSNAVCISESYTDKYSLVDLVKCACEKGSVGLMRLLFTMDLNVNQRNKFNLMLLLTASGNGHVEVVQLLLERKAGFENDEQYLLCLAYASEKGYVEVVRLMLERNEKMDTKKNLSILIEHGMQGGHVEMVRMLMARNEEMNSEKSLEFFLHHASGRPHIQVVRLLIEKGAKADEMYRGLCRPLHRAAANGCVEVVRLLLAEGATVDKVDFNGATPIQYAIGNGHAEVVQVLLQNGAEVDEVLNLYNIPPLFVASQRGHFEVARILLEKGALLHACIQKTQHQCLSMVRESDPHAQERMQRFLEGKPNMVFLNALDIARIMHGEESEICQLLIQAELKQRAERKHAAVTMMGILTRRAGLFRNYVPKDLVPMIGQMIFPRHVRKTGSKV